jgi:hypothetical protein
MAQPIKSPRIAIIYDHKHSDSNERAITERLSNIDPQKKIVFFGENRCLESESLNQYSTELLHKDDSFSTANPCLLLIAHILTGRLPKALKSILTTIYTDTYFKQLFTGEHYAKYDPHNYGLNGVRPWKRLVEANITFEQRNAIENVKGLFKYLDEELPKLPFREREDQFEGHMTVTMEAMVAGKYSCDYSIFGPISEALAFIKIKQVHTKLDPNADKTNELSLSMINQLYNEGNSVDDLFKELNGKFRTQFQVKKVIKIVERILKKSNQDPETIFVVRVGFGHREIMSNQLTQHFKNGDVKEISLTQEDLPQVEQRIKDHFS